MSKTGIVWFVAAGVFAIARWLVEFADVQYYDPETLLDYSAVILQTVAGLATGLALIVLWRNPPVKRGAFLLALGGLAAISQGLGNLFEDAFGWSWAVWGFFIGGNGVCHHRGTGRDPHFDRRLTQALGWRLPSAGFHRGNAGLRVSRHGSYMDRLGRLDLPGLSQAGAYDG